MTRTCQACNTAFDGRRHAKTCSPKCRKRLQRLTQAAAQELEKIVVRTENVAHRVVDEVRQEVGLVENSLEQVAESQAGSVAIAEPLPAETSAQPAAQVVAQTPQPVITASQAATPTFVQSQESTNNTLPPKIVPELPVVSAPVQSVADESIVKPEAVQAASQPAAQPAVVPSPVSVSNPARLGVDVVPAQTKQPAENPVKPASSFGLSAEPDYIMTPVSSSFGTEKATMPKQTQSPVQAQVPKLQAPTVNPQISAPALSAAEVQPLPPAEPLEPVLPAALPAAPPVQSNQGVVANTPLQTIAPQPLPLVQQQYISQPAPQPLSAPESLESTTQPASPLPEAQPTLQPAAAQPIQPNPSNVFEANVQPAANQPVAKKRLFRANKTLVKLAGVAALLTLMVGGWGLYIGDRTRPGTDLVTKSIPEQTVALSSAEIASLEGDFPYNQDQQLLVQGDGAFTGNLSAANFNGNGAGLTNLNASNISSGTLNAAQLPGNVTLLGNTIPFDNLQGPVISSLNGVTNNGGNINLIAGTNISITPDDINNTITISTSGVATSNSFATISAPAGTNPAASSSTDTLNLAISGSNLTITGDAGTDTLTFNIDESALAGAGLVANGDALDIGAGSGISVGANSLSLGALTANWNQTGAFDIVLNNASSELSILESVGDTFFGTIDIGDLSANRTYTFPDETGTVCLTTGNCAGIGGIGDILNNGQPGTVRVGTNDATSLFLETSNTDRLTIDSAGTFTLTGTISSSFVFGGVTIDANELNLLDGHDVALIDTNDAVNTAIVGTGALDSGSITANFGSIDTGADNITTTGTVSGNNFDRSSSGALTFGNTNATSVSICNSAACDTITIGTNADADTISIGDGLDTLNLTAATTTISGNTSGAANALVVTNSTSTGNILVLNDNLTSVVTVADGGVVTFQNSANSTAALQINNSSGVSLLSANTTAGTINLGTANSLTGALVFSHSTGTGGITLQGATPGASSFTITLPAATGTVCLTSGNCAGVGGTGDLLNNGQDGPVRVGTNDATSLMLETNNTDRLTITSGGNATYVGGTTGDALTISNSTSTGNILVLQDNATNVLTIADGGAVTLQNSTDSTTGLQILDADGGNPILNVDTTNERVGIGLNNPGYALDVSGDVNLQTGNAFRIGGTAICTSGGCVAATGSTNYIQNGTALQTGANFNIESNSVNDVAGVLKGALGQIADLFNLQDGNGVNVLSVGATGDLLVRPSTNSATAFAIQDSSSNNFLVADTSGGAVNICNSANCDTINIGTNADADAINIGDSLDTLTLTGSSASTIVLNGITISAGELNLLDGHDVALIDTNDAVNTAIVGTGALDSGSITANFGSIDTGADNITTTGTVSGNNFDRSSSGALTFGNTNATSVSICNSAACDTITIGTNADADTISIGDSTDTLTLTGNSSSTLVLNGLTIDATELGRLDGKDAALVDTNDAVSTAIIGTGALNSGSITSGFGSIDVGATDSIATDILNGSTATTLTIGNANSTGVSICNSAACDTIEIGNNSDADTLTIGDINDTVGINGVTTTITGSTAGASTTLTVSNSTSTGNIVDFKDNSTIVASIADGGAALFQNSADSTSAFQIQNQAGTSNLFVADTTNTRIGIGTASPTEMLTVAGNIKIGKQADSVTNWSKVTDATAGTIASGGTSGINTVGTMLEYNGSLYIGTAEADAAEIYRYDGGTTWTKVSQSTAGTIAASGTASINAARPCAVYNGSMYVTTSEANAAEVYRYDGDTTWTKVSQSTAGTIASGGTASIDGAGVCAVFNGNLYVGTGEADAAEVYRYNGGTSWTKVSQAAAGTIAAAGTASINSISAMAVYNGSLYVGTEEANATEIYRYDGGTTWTKVSQATAGTIAASGTASIDRVQGMAVYNGALYVGTSEGNSAEVYRYDGGTTWTKVSQSTAGTIAASGRSGIDKAWNFSVYNGRLYVGTEESGAAEIYRYDGGTTWTKVSASTAGTIASGGTSGIFNVTSLTTYNGSLYAGVGENNAAEVYKYTAVEGQSYALKFGAASDNTVPPITATMTLDGRSATNATSYTIGAGTLNPSANKLQVLFLYNKDSGGGNPTDATVTGCNLTWVRMRSQWHSTSNEFSFYRAMGSSPGTNCSLTVDFSGQTQTHLGYGLTEFGNVDTSGADGEGAIARPVNGTNCATGTSCSLSMAAPTSPFNAIVAGISLASNQDPTAEANWTHLQVNTGTSDAASLETMWRSNVDDTTPSWTFTSSSGAILGAEIKRADGDGSSTNEGAISFVAEQNPFNNPGNINTGSFMFTHGITTATGAYDLAEDYPTRDDSLTAGDVVSIDPSEYGFVKKTASANDPKVVGIYSTKPGLRLSQKDATIDGGRAVPIALAGRVPVKVTNEGGPIVPGDFLTSSSTPGYAMKATGAAPIIGKALASFDGATGTVLTFVNISSYSPATETQALQGSSLEYASLNITGGLTTGTLTVAGTATFSGNIVLSGHFITAGNQPTITPNEAAGEGAQATIEGNDVAGQLMLNTGEGIRDGKLLTVQFNAAYSQLPRIQFKPANADAAKLKYYVEPSGSGFTINIIDQPTGSGTYAFNYWVVQ